MGMQRVEFQVEEGLAGHRLDTGLASLMNLSKSKSRKLIALGAVYVNRRRLRIASKTLFHRARIEVIYDPNRLDDSFANLRDTIEIPWEKAVLYEDADLIVINKPPGLPTQPTLDQSVSNLFDALKAHTGGYVGMHHRLDKSTSGVMVFAKSRRANAGLAAAFRERTIKKTYLALTEIGEVPRMVQNQYGKVGERGKRQVFGTVAKGGQEAITELEIVRRGRKAQWVQARPLTGRTHQIRSHLAEAGFPILGDWLYGAKESGFTAAMLHAWRLELLHPVTRQPLKFEAPLPEAFQLGEGA